MTVPRWSPAPEAEYPAEWAEYRRHCAEGAALVVEPSHAVCRECGRPMAVTPELVHGYGPRIVGGTVLFQGDTLLGRLECLNTNCPAGPGWHQRKRESMQNANNIPWADAETTGLMDNPATVPLEFAFIITDGDLNEIDSLGPVVFSATEEELAAMGDYVRDMHTKTGLLEKVRASTLKREDFDDVFAEFLSKYIPAKGTPLETVSLNEPKGEFRGGVLAGNSVKLDIEVLAKFFPKTRALLDYRLIDVSTISELAKRWNPKAWASMPPKASDHTAMTDIRASIDELRYYRDNGFNGL